VKVVEDFERTKQFQFTLQPSVREKINRLAKENGYRSASSFLNDYFKNL
jgi:ORF16-like protein